MKSTLTLAAVFTLLNIQLNIIPNIDLLIVMGGVIIIDFVTGVVKAVIKKQARTSEGYKNYCKISTIWRSCCMWGFIEIFISS